MTRSSSEIKAAQWAKGISLASMAFAMAVPFSAYAQGQQDQEVQDPIANDVEEENIVIVTGFRASLESAIEEKRNADQILESVSAEDIGKLPDASIAESIARLPGITTQRLSGRANVISIRGLVICPLHCSMAVNKPLPVITARWNLTNIPPKLLIR